MITLEQIKHGWILKDFLRVDKLYIDLLDGISLDEYTPNFNECLWFQIEIDKYPVNIPIGLIMIKQFTSNCVAIHGGLFKRYRNDKASTYLQEIMKKIRGNETWKYVSTTGSKNKAAQKLLEKTGFVYTATLPNGYKTDDLMIYSEITCSEI